jgi:tRNA-splicing ligase RtcB (3'-phosphate/5'-hydroxy nucleic acid ligase)
MEKIGENIVAFLPADTIEPQALQQIKNTASMPFLYRHVAVMPDVHYGKGSTVGTVLPTKGAIIPAAVGVDIGCGMIAVRTNIKKEDILGKLRHLRMGIERRIPMSAGKFNHKITVSAQRRLEKLEDTPGAESAQELSNNWRFQLGTLGGGNHFIELCLDENGAVWATLHSGSRGVGNRIGMTYIKKAQEICEKNFVQLPDRDLAYLVEGTKQFDNYIRDMRWAQEFARANREEMMDRYMAELATLLLGNHNKFPELELHRINSHHNFTTQEKHFGSSAWITRKGAIKADLGDWAMIPGSMGTRSYIVRGKANVLAFKSAPHGAGRRFSRGQAKRQFTMADFDTAMAGIEHRRTEVLLDEIPGAYKDIDEVMENAKDLVEVKAVLKQVLNVKGD